MLLVLVSKLYGVKESVSLPCGCSMAVFLLNFSHYFCDQLVFLNKKSDPPYLRLIHTTLKQSIVRKKNICAEGNSDFPINISKAVSKVRLV